MATKSVQSAAASEEVASPLKRIEKINYLGVDDGHFGTKICMEDGRCFSIPSRAAFGIAQVTNFDDSDQDNVYEIAGEHFTVVDKEQSLSKVEDTRFLKPAYPVNPINRAIVHHAIIRAGMGGKKLAIATGLPIEDYYIGGKKNDDMVDLKIANLLNADIKNMNPKVRLAKIVQHNVMAEGIAAYLDLALNFDGEEIKETAEMVEDRALAIVDVGGKTTDIALVREGGSGIYPERSGTKAIGALNFYNSVGARLKERFQLNEMPPLNHIEQAIRTKLYKIFGELHDVSVQVETEARAMAQQLKAMMMEMIRQGSDVGNVVFVGGGSILLRDYLAEEYRNQAVFPKNPEFSNARGLLKAAKFLYANAD